MTLHAAVRGVGRNERTPDGRPDDSPGDLPEVYILQLTNSILRVTMYYTKGGIPWISS